MFDLPIDDSGVREAHDIFIWNFAGGSGTTGASCYAWSYDGDGNGSEGSSGTLKANGDEMIELWTSIESDYNIALLCDVPPGEGIGALAWTAN